MMIFRYWWKAYPKLFFKKMENLIPFSWIWTTKLISAKYSIKNYKYGWLQIQKKI